LLCLEEGYQIRVTGSWPPQRRDEIDVQSGLAEDLQNSIRFDVGPIRLGQNRTTDRNPNKQKWSDTLHRILDRARHCAFVVPTAGVQPDSLFVQAYIGGGRD
jgi:hypothetical protein